VAANYGGRWDIVESVKTLAGKMSAGEVITDELTEEAISANLSTREFPEPDLFIRTGGEKRISNFLLWQMAYCELYFTDVLWPDFGKDDLHIAIADFSTRQRRFGKTGDQVEEESGNT
jgi:undecaprenyl diphosphate synthase